MDLAFGAFSDRVKVKKQDDSGTTAKVTIAGGGPNACTIQAYHPYGSPCWGQGPGSPDQSHCLSKKGSICFKRGQEGHWKDECPHVGKVPRTLPSTHMTGRWQKLSLRVPEPS